MYESEEETRLKQCGKRRRCSAHPPAISKRPRCDGGTSRQQRCPSFPPSACKVQADRQRSAGAMDVPVRRKDRMPSARTAFRKKHRDAANCSAFLLLSGHRILPYLSVKGKKQSLRSGQTERLTGVCRCRNTR